LPCKTFAEPLEPRGESSFIGTRLVSITVSARVAHGLDTRGCPTLATRLPPEAARTILIGFCQVKKRTACPNYLNLKEILASLRCFPERGWRFFALQRRRP
jgi:hypothetical protein